MTEAPSLLAGWWVTESGLSSGSAPGSSGLSSGSAPGSSGLSSGSAPGSSGARAMHIARVDGGHARVTLWQLAGGPRRLCDGLTATWRPPGAGREASK
jgi:hypothetical protein